MIDPPPGFKQIGAGAWRPILPSRATYWICFGLAGFLTFGMLPYLLWARSRGLIDWHDLLMAEVELLTSGVISLLIGVVLRWRWLKKRKALHDYEAMLALVASRNGS